MLNEYLKLTGSVHVQLFDENMKLKQEHVDHNLIVTVGKTALAAWIAAASQADYFMKYIALGTSSTPAAAGDTALGTEFSGGGYSRQIGVITSSTNTWQNIATFSPGNGTGAVVEAGLFSASSGPTLFAHQVFSVYNKAAGDTLIVTWTVTFS